MKIAVIGSGVVGLTTALELQDEYRNATVTIIAHKFYKETTSFVAAGIFRPGKRNFINKFKVAEGQKFQERPLAVQQKKLLRSGFTMLINTGMS